MGFSSILMREKANRVPCCLAFMLALLNFSFPSCSMYDPYSPEAKQARAEKNAMLQQERYDKKWGEYIAGDEKVRSRIVQYLYIRRGADGPHKFDDMKSESWRWERKAIEYGEALDQESFQNMKASIATKYPPAMEEIETELRELFGPHYETYVLDFRQQDELGESLSMVDERISSLDEHYAKGEARGIAYRDSLVDLLNQDIGFVTEEGMAIRVVDAGLEKGVHGAVVLEFENEHPNKILYFHLERYGSYQDDSGVERSYSYFTGVGVADNFDNRFKVRKIERGHLISDHYKYSLGIRKDLPLRPGEQLRILFAFAPLPPETASTVEFEFFPQSLDNANRVRIVVPAKHVFIKRTQLKGMHNPTMALDSGQ